jgi:hypothetical protein
VKSADPESVMPTVDPVAFSKPPPDSRCTIAQMPAGSRDWRSTRRVILAIGVALAIANPSRADIGVIVLEPIGALGFFTRVGHAGTYFSNICQDGSPIKMRLCLAGESGGVVSKYAPLSDHEDYDWAIVPFEEYLHGVASADFAPMIGTQKLQSAI